MRILCWATLLAGIPAWVNAACSIKPPTAIYCSSGTIAHAMYSTYGEDDALMHESNNVAIIHRSGCAFVARGAKVVQLDHGRVPLLDGWAGVTTVLLNDKMDGIIVDQYLVGKCDVYKPETYVSPGLESPNASTTK